MKIKKEHHKYYLLAFLIISIGAYLFLFTSELISQKKPQKMIEVTAKPTKPIEIPEEREYVSELGFKIIIPNGYNIEEVNNSLKNVIIKKEINYERYLPITNFDNIISFVRYLETKNNIKIKIENKLKINNYESAKGLIKYPISGRELKRTFFIMPDNWVVYTFSTSSPELYEDLEKIVRGD